VNGVYCESLAAAAKKAAAVLNREVSKSQIQRALGGQKEIQGITVSHKPPVKEDAALTERIPGAPLLRYPLGERPIDRGIPKPWR
jgi:hypothetical protein